MTSAIMAFGIAVGGASLICYALMTRLENRRANRRLSRDRSGSGGSSYSMGDGWSLANWFGTDNPASQASYILSDGGGRRKRLTLPGRGKKKQHLIWRNQGF